VKDAHQELLSDSPDRWLAAIVESSDDAIIGKTLDSVIRSWNAGATRVFGYEAVEIIGHSVLELMPPELQYQEKDIIARLGRGERIDHFETVRLRRDGSRIEVSLSVSPIRDESGRIIGAAKLARDITEAKRLQRIERELSEQLAATASELEAQVEEAQALQEELEQTNEVLERALEDAVAARRQAEEANAAKSQFLAKMSHELRTPLNAIAGYVDLLQLGVRGALNGEQLQDLDRIKRGQRTLLRLIEDLLNFAKLEAGQLEFHYQDLRIDDVLAAAETFIAPLLSQKGLAYRFEPCGSDVVVSVDADKVEQIILNLLSNAVKFTGEGGIALVCTTSATEVRVDVRDSGRGIRAELLERVFEPFVQEERSFKNAPEGTGLGLSISRELARAMGGDITVASTVGTGSVFTLVLPRR
jgi:PAS domain S-box-containing protein